ncbi:MAG TPA: AI-2E family transporter [Roseiflexaceae bacterium]|nr:AI-2E family transporter [Roseiflexaceae bacterium]
MKRDLTPAVKPPISTTELEQNQMPADGVAELAQAHVDDGKLPADRDLPGAPVVPTETSVIVYPSARTLARWLLVLLALYSIGWLLWTARPALTPFIIGLVLAYLLTPVVNILSTRMKRPLAILAVYVVGIGLIVGAFTFVIPLLIDQVRSLIRAIPSVEGLEAWAGRLFQQYENTVPPEIREPINNGVSSALRTLQANLTGYAQRVGGFVLDQVLQVVNTITFLIGFLIIPIWLFYILNDQEEGRSFVDRMLHRRIRPDFWNLWGIVNRILMDYVRGQLLLCVMVGAAVGVGLFILRLLGIEVEYILLLALLAGVTEFVPVIGPIIGAVPAVVLALFSDQPINAVWVGLVYVIVQQLENNLLVPRIIGESVGVHPAILTVLLLAMGQIFGLAGVILAAPLAAIARDLFLYIYRRLGGLSPDSARSSLSAPAISDLNAINQPKPAG